jgi:hypothetical protein
MQKNIKFIYGALIITLIGSGISFLVLKQSENKNISFNTVIEGKKNIENLDMAKYAGKYEDGFKKKGDSGGSIIIYPETDTTVKFYLELSNGGVSNNSGIMYGRLTIDKNGIGHYVKVNKYNDNEESVCHFSVYFSPANITIKEDKQGQYKNDEFQDVVCGFGNGVYAYGIYERKDVVIPEYFSAGTHKYYFKDIDPETFGI